MYFNQLKNAIFSELKSQKALPVQTYQNTKERYQYFSSKLKKFEESKNEDYFNEIEYIKSECLPAAMDKYAFAKIQLDCLVCDIIKDIIINNESIDWLLSKQCCFKKTDLTIDNINEVSKFDFATLSEKLLYSVDADREITKRTISGLSDIYFMMINIVSKNGKDSIEKLTRIENKSLEVFKKGSFLTELYFDFNYYSKGTGVLEKFLLEITDKNSSFYNLTDDDLIKFATPSNILSAKIDVTEDNNLTLDPEYIIKKCNKQKKKHI